MSDKTADSLIYEVAAILGKVVAGEALASEDYALIDGCIDPVLSEISSIIYLGDRDAIPDLYFQTIARLIAVHAAAKFSNATVDLDLVRQHEQRLRYLTADRPTYQPLVSEYF